MILYHCKICSSKVLEKRLQKHHAKVHPNTNYDIYEEVPELPTGGNVEAQAIAQAVANVDLEEWGLEAPKDDSMIHVTCHICHNKMPKSQLEGHMKRKHADAADQVDAIGVMVDKMSLDMVENSINMPPICNPFRKTMVYNNNASGAMASAEPATNPVEFGKNYKPFAPKDNDEFYTVRISKRQMQIFLDQKRIYPKDGMFYVEDS